ncbi:MAG: hypothetical protein KC468_25940 [Myxococcales bacterium]|nr:hypothetical protein [Myxococcales bacterium]
MSNYDILIKHLEGALAEAKRLAGGGVIPNTAKPIRVKWLNPHKEAYGLREVQGNRADKEPIVVPPGEFQEVDSSIGAVWHVVARPGTDEERVVSQLGPMVAGGPVNIKVGN